MSLAMEVETGKMTLYDDDGRTYLPDDIKEAIGATKGDVIKLVAEDGEFKGKVVEESEEK